MNGKSLTYKQGKVLQESSSGNFLDALTSYDYLYEAAKELGTRTKALTASTTITTVANQANYDLPADFNCLYVTNSLNEFVLKLNDGSSDFWLNWMSYERVKLNSHATAIPVPPSFSIVDKQTAETNITGTATSTTASSGGLSTLNDTTAPFAGVSAGDKIYDTTDGSEGIVSAKISNSALATAMFNGTNDFWTSGDAYVIIPQNKKQIVFSVAPSVAGYVATVEYIQKPLPVYSLYESYRFDSSLEMALVYYSCWLYKYRDREPNYGDAMYKHFDRMCRRGTFDTKRAINQVSWHFNLNKRSYRDRSIK
jgi:hypothetical protein